MGESFYDTCVEMRVVRNFSAVCEDGRLCVKVRRRLKRLRRVLGYSASTLRYDNEKAAAL